jgi:hypothetical protein
MCLVIDANTFNSVFDKTASDHRDFEPVFKWIYTGKGKAVFGGTKYRRELSSAPRYLKIFNELGRLRKTVEVDGKAVDACEKRINKSHVHRDLDDGHIIAIVSVSRCRIVCSNDRRAFPFLKMQRLYPRGVDVPKIFSGKKNHCRLLSTRNMASCCL